MKKLAIIILTVLFTFCFSIVAFAEETQVNNVDESRNVSGKEVFIVFESYLSELNGSAEKVRKLDTIKKSDLYSLIKSSNKEKILPTKIRIDFISNPEDLITEQDLLKYIDEIENNFKDIDVTISFSPFSGSVVIMVFAY